MNEFQRRWKRAITVARPRFESAPSALPYGFATRVIAQWRGQLRSPPPGAAWQPLAWRVLGAMTLVLLGIVLLGAGPREPFAPAIEDAVAETFWML